VEIRNGRDVAGQVMTKPDQEGLIVKNIINRDVAGASGIILLSSELPPGKVHLLHRHPNAEQIMYVLEALAWPSPKGERCASARATRCSSPRASGTAFATTATDRNARDLRGAGTLEEAGYEEHPRQVERD
jgi:hypothetical protein